MWVMKRGRHGPDNVETIQHKKHEGGEVNTGSRLCQRASGMSSVADGVASVRRIPNGEDNRFDLEGY
jgi:hypothetical protein